MDEEWIEDDKEARKMDGCIFEKKGYFGTLIMRVTETDEAGNSRPGLVYVSLQPYNKPYMGVN